MGKTFTKRHGLSRDPLYSILKGMRERCYNPNCESYDNYGKRGIGVCDKWMNDDNYKGLKSFVTWGRENGYEDGLSIERIDVDGDYTPENCTFITMEEQQANKRTTRFITVDGVTKHLSEWSRLTGLGHSTITRRLDAGWDENTVLNDRIEQQAAKQSSVVGVTWNTTRSRWKATSRLDNKNVFIGWFKRECDAIESHRDFCNKHNIKIKLKLKENDI